MSDELLTLRAHNYEDLVALVPVTLGFQPEESLVMLGLEGPQRFNARVDLPGSDVDIDDVVDVVMGPVVQHQLETVAFVIVSEAPAEFVELAARVLDRALAEDLNVAAVLGDTGQLWCELDEPELTWRAYDSAGHRFRSQAVMAGQVTYGSRAEKAQEVARDEHRSHEAEQAIKALYAVQEAFDCVDERHWMETVFAHWEAGREELSATDVARLISDICRPELRDIALGRIRRSAMPGNARLWRDVLRCAPQGWVTHAAGLAALSTWVEGDGALAWSAVERAEEVVPTVEFAATFLQNAVPPRTWDDFAERIESSNSEIWGAA